jgi:aspartate racemase
MLKAGGADFIIICSNTLCRHAPEVERNIGIHVHSIADAVAGKIRDMGMRKVGLLGTKYAMEGDYYRNILQDKYGIEPVIPDAYDREFVNNIIFEELCLGIIKQSSKEIYKDIIAKLQQKGAEGIILGCTEIPLLIKQEDVSIPVFDTTAIHAVTAVELALKR